MSKKIAVFAGNECVKNREQYYYSLAYKTGKLLAEAGFTVVTGGGPGLMDETMRGAHDAGGETIGVCLNIEGRIQSRFITKKILFDHLNPRQEKLLNISDSYIAIPGGIGTLYEVLAVLSLKRKLDIPVDSPLILIDEYFNGFRKFLDFMLEEGFVSSNVEKLFLMVKTPEEAVKELKRLLR
jgi:hypothetical protein